MSSAASEIKKLAIEMRALGWTVEPTRSQHLKWLWGSAKPVFTSSTPSDHRALDNIKADLRRTMQGNPA